MNRLPLCLVALALVFPATAAAGESKFCQPAGEFEALEVTNVKCGKARKVLEYYYSAQTAPKGWSCNQKRNPAGQKTTCTKGNKKIVYATAD